MSSRGRVALIAVGLLLSACQPVVRPGLSAAPLTPVHMPDSGMVIGTLAWSLSEQPALGAHALARLSRVAPLEGAGATSYFLDVELDPLAQQGRFGGVLPAGVYALDEALTPAARLVPATLRMPFEVRPGAVTDAGHFALTPAQAPPSAALFSK